MSCLVCQTSIYLYQLCSRVENVPESNLPSVQVVAARRQNPQKPAPGDALSLDIIVSPRNPPSAQLGAPRGGLAEAPAFATSPRGSRSATWGSGERLDWGAPEPPLGPLLVHRHIVCIWAVACPLPWLLDPLAERAAPPQVGRSRLGVPRAYAQGRFQVSHVPGAGPVCVCLSNRRGRGAAIRLNPPYFLYRESL